MPKTFIFLFLLLPCVVFAQFNISGSVVNHDDNLPVANVSVFLNNATIGDQTTVDGTFALRNVKPGKYDLIVSIVGFSTYSQPIIVTNTNITLPAIYLLPKVITLNEVKIKPQNDPTEKKNFDIFRNWFLGTSDIAKECKIINPEMLDLSYDEKSKILTGKSFDFLIIENKVLGYRVKYLLSNFILNNYDPTATKFLYEGAVLFEELKGTPSQEEQWKKRRQEVYANSVTHFLRAAVKNKLQQEGFSAFRYLSNPERPADSVINTMINLFSSYKDKRKYRDSLSSWIKKSKLPRLLPGQVPLTLTGEDFIEKTNKPGLYAFTCSNDYLYVVYNNKTQQFHPVRLSNIYDQNNTSGTLVTFNKPFAFFDSNGSITNPGCLTYSGVWANKRIAELLPVDYEPPQTEPPVDSTLIKKIDDKLNAYTAGHLIEKAYLHFDKPYYAAGDTIYFKAYVTTPLYEPSALSNILNVELIGPANNICRFIKLKVEDGIAAGDFDLPDTLKEGHYRLRAYTKAMRNAGEEYFFDQYVYIVKSLSNEPVTGKRSAIAGNKTAAQKPTQSKAASGKVNVQFFPEGGNLLNGILSKIAFKAVGPDGLGAEIKGKVMDESGKQVSTFVSQHLGMGIIVFTPLAGKKYKADITFADSTKATFDLPKAFDTGYALRIDNTDLHNLSVNIIAGEQNHGSQINLIAQSGGAIYSYTSGKLVKGKFMANIPKNIFPDGIVQFTLFSENGEPMNERLVFIQNHDQLNLKLSTDHPVYNPRQKAVITLNVKDKDYAPVTGDFSVAVIDQTRVPVDEDNESTILAHLLLTSDIKGYIEKPNYYFNPKNSNADNALDILMLTQGYHRFEWKSILNNEFQTSPFEPEKITTVSGKIKTTGGKPVPYGKVSLLSVTKVFFALDTIADANGRFEFEHLPLMDSMRYIIQATDKKIRKNTYIEVDYEKHPKTTGNKNSPDAYIKENNNLSTFRDFSSSFHREQFKQGINKNSILLKEVVIKEKKELKYLKHSANLNGPGNANKIITADQLPPGCLVFKDCIAGSLHGIQYAMGNFYYGFFPTTVMIDGIEVPGNLSIINGQFSKKEHAGGSQADVLNTLNISDIASIEIITDASLAAVYGVQGGGGVILITMKRWDDLIPNVSNLKPRFANYTPLGYYKARIFYSPQYDLQKTNSTIKDLRTTIYWDPFVLTDKNGNGTFSFFNADTKGNYRIVVEGIDNKGHIGRQVYNYNVE